MNDILERLQEMADKPQRLSIRQLIMLRERARVLARWKDVEKYTEQLEALGYYN